MKTPSKAVILAAGFGVRLMPLTRHTPKALLPLWGKPMLAWTLEMLERWGVRSVLINLHHAPAPILDFLRSRAATRLRIDLSFEPGILGTGGALPKAEWFLDQECFWIINGDVVADVNPAALIDVYRKTRPLAAVWLNDQWGPRTVQMANRFVSDFRSATPGGPHTYTFCGLHLASRRLLDFTPPGECSSIIDAYARAMQKGHRIAGACPRNAFWADIGTPADYLEAHRRTFEAARRHQPGGLFLPRRYSTRSHTWASLGHHVRVEPGSRIFASVVHDDVLIRGRARLDHAIVAEGVTVDGRVNGMALRADSSGSPALISALERMEWAPHETTLMPLAPRGSARVFTRIRRGQSTAIVIEYSMERPENALYVQNAAFLQTLGIRVPGVLLNMPDRHLTVMEDAGDRSLRDRIAGRSPARIARTYETVIRAIMPLHQDGARLARKKHLPLCEPFCRKLYRWERDLFAVHFLADHLHLPDRIIRDTVRDLEGVATTLLHEPPVLIHRDLQSSNILFPHETPVFIDFQGMRLGPALYDLASLLCDPYVSLPAPLQCQLLAFYGATWPSCPDNLAERFWAAAIERLCQAIGAFARMSHARETAGFADHIRPALKMLDRALYRVDDMASMKGVVSQILNQEGA